MVGFEQGKEIEKDVFFVLSRAWEQIFLITFDFNQSLGSQQLSEINEVGFTTIFLKRTRPRTSSFTVS